MKNINIRIDEKNQTIIIAKGSKVKEYAYNYKNKNTMLTVAFNDFVNIYGI